MTSEPMAPDVSRPQGSPTQSSAGLISLVQNLIYSDTLAELAHRTIGFFENTLSPVENLEELTRVVVFRKGLGPTFGVFHTKGPLANRLRSGEFRAGDWVPDTWEKLQERNEVFKTPFSTEWLGGTEQEPRTYHLRSVPFRANDNLVGYYLLISRKPFTTPSSFRHLAEQFGSIVGDIVQYKQKSWKVEDRLETFEIIDRFYQRMNELSDWKETLRFCLRTFQTIFDAPDGSIMIYDGDIDALEVVYSTTPVKGDPLHLKPGQGAAGRALQSDSIVKLSDVEEDALFLKDSRPTHDHPRSLLCIPLCSSRRKIGVVNLVDRDRRRNFDPDQVPGLELLQSRIAAAVENLIAQRELEKVAQTDELTGIYNRRFINDHLETQFELYQQSNTPFGLILVDLDRFKRINDSWGHQVGDRVLKAFATRLRTHARENDLVGRFGGDEFMVVLCETSRDQALEQIQFLKEKFEGFEIRTDQGETIHPTASFGLAVADEPQSASSVEELLRDADNRLYQAKEQSGFSYSIG